MTDDFMSLGYILQRLFGASPVLLVYLAAGVLCAIYARRKPKAVVLTGIALMLFVVLLGVSYFVIPYVYRSLDYSSESYKIITTLIHFGQSTVYAIAYGLLFWAIFWGDSPQPPQRFD